MILLEGIQTKGNRCKEQSFVKRLRKIRLGLADDKTIMEVNWRPNFRRFNGICANFGQWHAVMSNKIMAD
jgi:hypothetical protein